MTKTKQNEMDKLEEVLTSIKSDVVYEEQKVNTPTFVVIRNGCRVSEHEYNSENDPYAIAEKNFWQKIVNRYPDGTKIEIVQFDKKKHKIFVIT